MLNAVADWLWVAALAAWATALLLLRNRRRGLAAIGVGLILVGAVLLIGRNVAGHHLVASLVENPTARPAVQTAWTIVTARLAVAAWVTIGTGMIVLLAVSLRKPRVLSALR